MCALSTLLSLLGAQTQWSEIEIRHQIDTVDNQIDQLAYESYGSIDEETRIIEDTS